MADNVIANAGSGGATFATDDIASVHYPRSKVVWGVDGVAVDASASNPLPVVQTGTPALPTGAATETKQDTAITSLQLLDDVVKTDDAAFTPATDKVAMVGATFDDVTPDSVNEGDAGALRMSGNRNLYAQVRDAAGNERGLNITAAGAAVVDGSAVTQPVSAASLPLPSGAATAANQTTGNTALSAIQTAVETLDNAIAGAEMQVDVVGALPAGTNAIGKLAANSGVDIGDVDVTSVVPGTGTSNLGKAEDAAHASGDVGVMALAVRRDARSSMVDLDGDYAALQLNASGDVRVDGSAVTQPVSAASLPLPSGASTLAEQQSQTTSLQLLDDAIVQDDAAFTPATTRVMMAGAEFDDTLPDSVNEGDAGALRMSANRNLYSTIRDAAGNERGANVTAGNALVVDGSAVTQPVSGTVTANLAAGTNNIGDVDVLSLPALPAGTNNIGDVDVLTLPALPAGTNNIGDVDVLTLPNVTLAAGTNTNEVVGDAAHDAAVAGNPVRVGLRAITADYTAVATGDTADAVSTILGKQVTIPYSIPDNTWNYAAAAGGLVNTTGVTAKAAAGAGVRNYITSIQVINSHATISTEVVVRDGAAGTVLHRGWAQAAGGGYACNFSPPLRGTANTLVEIAEVTATATTGVLVNLQGYSGAE